MKEIEGRYYSNNSGNATYNSGGYYTTTGPEVAAGDCFIKVYGLEEGEIRIPKKTLFSIFINLQELPRFELFLKNFNLEGFLDPAELFHWETQGVNSGCRIEAYVFAKEIKTLLYSIEP